jgi:PAS domain S-box-containing protein
VQAQDKTVEQLNAEVERLRRQVAGLRARETEHEQDRSLLTRVPVGLYRTTPAGQFLDVNPALAEMLGYPDRESLLTVNVVQQYVDPEDHHRWQAMLEREGVASGFETQLCRRDGTVIWVRESARAVYDAEGLLSCYEGSIEDITERKGAEEALRESEERYRLLFEDSPVCLWEEDFSAVKTHLNRLREDGVGDFRGYLESHPEVVAQCVRMVKVLDVNKAAIKLRRLQGKDQIPGDLTSVLAPDAYDAFREELIAIAAGQTTFESGILAQTVAGEKTYRVLRWSVAPGHEEAMTKVLVSVTDITDRKQAEEELRRLKDFNESIIRDMAEGIVVQDGELKLTFVNPAAASMLGYRPEELLGQYGTAFVPPDQQHIVRAADERRARGEADRYEVELLRKDGRRIPVLISGRPVFSERRFVGTLAVFTDISERVQAEEKLARRAMEMAALYDTSLEINAQLDLSALLNAIVQRASGLVGARMGGLYLLGPGEEELELVVSYNLPGDYLGTKLRLGEGLSGRVAKTGQPLMIDDYRQWEGQAAVYAGSPFRRVLGVPLRVGDRVIGAINVTDDEQVGPFSEEEIRLVSLFADQAAIAVENARLFEAEHTARQQAETLQAATQALSATLDLQQVLALILSELRRVVPYDSATVQQLEDDHLAIIGGHGFPNLEELLGIRFGVAARDNPNQEVVRTRAPLILDDAPSIYDEFRREPHSQAGTRSWLGVPLLFGDRLIGMISLDKKEPGFYTQEHAHLALAFAAQAAIAVENARLFRIVEQGRREWEATFDAMQDAVVLVDRDARILRANRAFSNLVQGAGQVMGQRYYSLMADAVCLESLCPQEQILERGQPAMCTHEYRGRFFEVQATPLPRRGVGGPGHTGGAIFVMRDITERIQMEEQFYQAQKMEALGKMAGGVAHDFNNLLTVIHLSTRLLQRQLHAEDPLWEHVQRIQEAGDRGTSLTKQLLSFSRREMVEPQVLNLTRVVEDLSLMLQRIIGENIQMVTVLAQDLWPVDVDPSQMDQVIVNLVVNARDAMPGGGTLTIETANVVLDEGYVAANVDVQPGRHVVLAIGDTGSGMAEEVKAHLFEPFFTTKQRGQGTGLGLPTVFGIVKQNEGHIRVHSEVGVGTTVRIYLPSAERAETPRRAVSRPLSSPTERLVQGTETVLVAEDEATVRDLAVQVLESCGYRVLAARNGLEALRIGDQYDGPIHLLLTDVVMPEMNGKELANRLQNRRPAIRVLYMSGYADDTIIRHGVTAAGTAFLSKPLTVENLTHKVRAVLDGRL